MRTHSSLTEYFEMRTRVTRRGLELSDFCSYFECGFLHSVASQDTSRSLRDGHEEGVSHCGKEQFVLLSLETLLNLCTSHLDSSECRAEWRGRSEDICEELLEEVPRDGQTGASVALLELNRDLKELPEKLQK